VVSLLAQHQSNPSSGHLDAAKYVVMYLANTKSLGIYVTSHKRSVLESFLHFLLIQKFFRCLTPTGVLRTRLNTNNLWSYHYFRHGSCQLSALIYWVPCTGFPNDNRLLREVLLKQKFMPPTSALSFFLNFFRSWNFSMASTYLCLLGI
jgi:hypothetical protein